MQQPGDMDAMFSSIENRFGEKYGIEIISRNPWIVTFENFLDDRFDVDCDLSLLWMCVTRKMLLERPLHWSAQRTSGSGPRILGRRMSSVRLVAFSPMAEPPATGQPTLPVCPPNPINARAIYTECWKSLFKISSLKSLCMDIALFWSISWCTGDCEKHPDVRRVLGKIAAVTGVPKQHYESFQASPLLIVSYISHLI